MQKYQLCGLKYFAFGWMLFSFALNFNFLHFRASQDFTDLKNEMEWVYISKIYALFLDTLSEIIRYWKLFKLLIFI